MRVSQTGEDASDDGLRDAPSVQWSLIFGTGHVRLYATTAIPTGLYRVSDRAHSGILSLNFGVVMRATWLDSLGHEGFLGLEAGMMAEGLANDVDATGHSLTQVATVTGLGLSVPIANRSLATETSINLHVAVRVRGVPRHRRPARLPSWFRVRPKHPPSATSERTLKPSLRAHPCCRRPHLLEGQIARTPHLRTDVFFGCALACRLFRTRYAIVERLLDDAA